MLSDSDPDPVIRRNPDARGPVLITCEHAGRARPAALGDMGVADADWDRHIAWDIGALDLASALADSLGARMIAQAYSRLVIDCNRPVHAPDLAAEISDGTDVPANRGLSEADRQARVAAIHRPFHDALASAIDQDRPALILSIHSFTPRMNDQDRPWHAGFLANRMPEAAMALMEIAAGRVPYLNFSLNEPYTVCDDTDYTIPVHGEANGIPHALVEVRNDQLSTLVGVDYWADLLSGTVGHYLRRAA